MFLNFFKLALLTDQMRLRICIMSSISTSKRVSLKARPWHLLHLPHEIRQQIYQHILLLPRKCHLSLLCTCRKVYEEGLPSFLSRPFTFPSQDILIKTLVRYQRKYLSLIHAIRFAITDLDEQTLRPYLTTFVSNDHNKQFISPYSGEIQRIAQLLAKLQNLKSLTIIRSTVPSRRQAPQVLLNGLLASLFVSVPAVTNVSLSVDTVAIHHLRNLQCLRSLCISGFSHSMPAQTLATLRNLPKLRTLHIRAAGYIMRELFFHCGKPHQSITPEVLTGIRPLGILTIMDPPEANQYNSPFMTSQEFDAIRTRHKDELESLAVCALHPITRKAVAALASLVRAIDHLKRFTIALPSTDESGKSEVLAILDNVNATHLTTLKVLVASSAEADAVLDMLRDARRGRPWAPKLRTIVFLFLDGEAALLSGTTSHVGVVSRDDDSSEGAWRRSKTAVSPDLSVPVGAESRGSYLVEWRRWRPFGEDDYD